MMTATTVEVIWKWKSNGRDWTAAAAVRRKMRPGSGKTTALEVARTWRGRSGSGETATVATKRKRRHGGGETAAKEAAR